MKRLDRGKKRILIADDSETYRAVASRVLVDAGYSVTEAVDGAQAVALLMAPDSHFDLVLTELNLPRVRGLEVIRRIRESKRLERMVVLVVTESMTEHLRHVLLGLRLDASLTKNHALRELLYQVDALLFPMDADERKSPRRLGGLPVNYWVGERLHLQTCFDVSEVGMFIIVHDEEPPPVGTPLSLRFWLPNADRLVACDAEVVWLNTIKGDLKDSHPPGIGLRFTRIRPEDAALVRAFLARPV